MRMVHFHLLDQAYDQTHRGCLIVEGQVLPLLRSRAYDGFLALQYDDRYTPLLKMAGLDVISYQVRRGMPKFNSAAITALVDMWRPETHSFHLPFGEMTVTLQDCQKMLGLSIRGWVVTGSCVSEGWRARVAAFLGREVDEQGTRTSGVLISWLREHFGQCPQDADAETVGHYCRAWILNLFACVLFPDATGDTASWMWIHCLTDWHQARLYSWGSAVLCFLYRQLCEACRRTAGSALVGGCVYLLQLWMWARLPVGRSEIMPRRPWFPGEMPRRQPTWAYIWDQVKISHTRLDRAYLDYINEIDALTAHSVNWQPYQGEDALPFTLNFVCGLDEDLYRMKCPLICFYAVEYHLPDRVARQFGMRQIWPPPATSTSVELHNMDRKKKRKVSEWVAFHQAYIDDWENFNENVDENDEPHTNSEYRQYQTWYQGATCHRLRAVWMEDDYADIHSSDDEDTVYDQSTRAGRQVEAGPILDRMGRTLQSSVRDIEHFRPRVTNPETRSFLQRLSNRLRRAAARCGCRTAMTRDVHVPSLREGGVDYDFEMHYIAK
ncbi:serine/threonine-protein phosphatase 7 long form homolog [Setaria viridis]|uniref:serine/threonine-protein phosphatase 7 long form homolog n=1 Tax=Setaria viridis TaxID=4556 RepID=UPI003B3A4F3C